MLFFYLPAGKQTAPAPNIHEQPGLSDFKKNVVPESTSFKVQYIHQASMLAKIFLRHN
jgi:hypothetical protein